MNKKPLKLIASWEKKQRIGSYEIIEKIGSGGMGIVYKVNSLIEKSKTFAMKVMREEYLLDEVHKKRFENETRLVDRLEHPNIVKVVERGEDKKKLYLVMELLEGVRLAERLENEEPLSVLDCIHILLQVTDVLVKLHNKRIIHRDLKPENIMLIQKNGDPLFVKLLDFGLARMQTVTHLTEKGQILGTLPYVPPELLSNGEISTACDVYALGMIAYEILTNRKPFIGNTPIGIMNQILIVTPMEPKQFRPGIPIELNNLVMSMTAKDSKARPGAKEVLSSLQKIFEKSVFDDSCPG
jgi:serine/threonine-protein kinase